jgi:hypothetical protein
MATLIRVGSAGEDDADLKRNHDEEHLLALTRDEMRVLELVLNHLGGPADTSLRMLADRVRDAVMSAGLRDFERPAGMKWLFDLAGDMRLKSEPGVDDGITQSSSLYFKEGTMLAAVGD